ncbi:T9SS type A sorting domain-containing protein [Flavobacterium wongokense]|uniref:T9SS type A sorting domain-containing protein n=1 Tax=Flavobacterium wongokense TaxID=2910674 RepID=UPI001F359DE4|nr:T9SS type A sorting domain-containing protein [Flavobacterium sp. WG47]MCF6132229.1 T9SS type A sorting domain-containing protein [Flavobacterium sp. WG47]
MRKIIFQILMLGYALSINAQLADGSTAPDFTVTDLNGNSHTLSTYLNAGKRVIIDFSDIMCGPCYKYKQTEAMADFYNAYGPKGSNEVMVLFIEDGPNNSWVLNGLNGIYNPPTFGNWIAGSPYPMAISEAVPIAFSLNYYPYIALVCSNGLTYNIGQPSANNLKFWTGHHCGALTGVQNHVKVLDTETGFCSNPGSFKTRVRNYGTNLVTNMVLKLKKNGTVISTKTFTGALAQFATQEIFFDPITLDPTAQYTVAVTSVNGVANKEASFSTANATFHLAQQTGVAIEIKVHTYSYPDAMSWNIKNSAGTVVATGGPYPSGSTYANTVLTQTATLPNTPDCYTVELLAPNGYGWRNFHAYADDNPVAAGLEVVSNGTTAFSKLYVGNFGYSIKYENVFKVGTLGIEEPIVETFSIHPNPTTGLIRIKTLESFDLSVYDLTGKLIMHSENMPADSEVNLGTLQKGIYIAKIVAGDKSYQKKIVLQ